MAADVDGDGIADAVIYRPSTGFWYWLTSSSGFTQGYGWATGNPGDIPVLK